MARCAKKNRAITMLLPEDKRDEWESAAAAAGQCLADYMISAVNYCVEYDRVSAEHDILQAVVPLGCGEKYKAAAAAAGVPFNIFVADALEYYVHMNTE